MLIRSCVVLAALSSALLAAPTKQVHQTRPIDADGRVMIDTYKGSIHVSTWDRPEVDIAVNIEEDTGIFAQAARYSDVSINDSRHEVRIKSVDGGFLTGSSPLFHYTIRMPKTARLQIQDYKSTTEIDGLAADFQMNTYKGSVRVHNLKGALNVETYKGDVRVDGFNLNGRSRVQTYKGDIELALARDSHFDLRADLSPGAHLTSDFVVRSNSNFSGRRRNQSVAGPVNGGGPELILSSYKGSFRLLAR